MPRHPPCALDNLTNTPTPATQSSSKPKTTPAPGGTMHSHLQVKKKDARVHSALDNHTRRPPPPHQKPRCPAVTAQRKTTTPNRDGRPLRTQQCADATQPPANEEARMCSVFGSTSNQVSNHHPTAEAAVLPPREPTQPATTEGDPSHEQTPERSEVKLLRKEVIQPHLPVRLPCYDFVPIASPTFDRSPLAGWATGFGCYRLS